MKLIIIGILSGIVTGLGMGGGSFLILFLTLVLKVEQHTAQATNFLLFIPTAVSALVIHYQEHHINLKVGKKVLLTGAIGAAIGAYLTKQIAGNELKRYFGFFLLLVGISEIIKTSKEIYQNRKGKEEKK